MRRTNPPSSTPKAPSYHTPKAFFKASALVAAHFSSLAAVTIFLVVRILGRSAQSEISPCG
jgi:hypothetical protein